MLASRMVALNSLKSCVVLVLSLQKRALGINGTLVDTMMKEWTAKFEHSNIPEPESSIKNILAHVLQRKRLTDLLFEGDTELSEAQVKNITKLCECRLARMPVQYIIKEWDFRDLTLKMVPPVFIPRPETEELVDIIINKFEKQPPCHMIDIGSGSGAISIALLKHFPQLKGIAIDPSQHACDLTKENAATYDVSDKLDVIHTEIDNKGNIKNLKPELLEKKFDLIVSNPPYIPSLDIPHLDSEVSLYEDIKALDGGHDGLHVIKPICVFGSHYLKPNGSIFLEINHDHLEKIKEWLEICQNHMKLQLVEHYKDLGNKNRFVELKLTQ